MLYTEKELQDTLKKDVTISKETEKRMQETYAQIRRDTKTSKKRGRKHTSMAAAAALAVILISGTTAGAAYISAHTDLLGNVFGQQSRTTKEAYDTVVDNGKGGTTVTMPSREYVAVDEAQAEKLVEPYVEDLNITRKIGDYTLTIINNISDGNAGVLSLKLENPNGIKAIHADEGTNEAKGAYFTQDRDFYFYLEGADESLVADKMTIDSKKSSDTCYYLYSSYVCSAKNTNLKFHLEQYGKPVSELKDNDMATQKEDIALGIGKMPLTSAVNPENNKEQFAYSAISLSLNLANGFGLDDEIQKEDGQTFVDPYYLKKLVLKYKDGSEYTVLDENVDNTNYVCGEMENGDTIKIVFNRMVDWSQVETLVVNDVGMGDPFFCKYLCPQGVLEGAIPLSAVDPGIRSALGHLFTGKLMILIGVVVLSVLFYRPFCKWLCPLGAFYALMNKVSLLGIKVDEHRCVSCGACRRVCQMDVDVTSSPNHTECIRCGKCINACPTDAVSFCYGFASDSNRNGEKK